MPRVTIGVPVYNAESLLEQCLGNLAAQTFQDFKVIVLDNASTDGTATIAQRFAERDPRFTYRRQPQNKGAFANFVDVLGMAETEYFMWRADDDLSDVNFVEALARLLDANPRAALAVGLTVLDKRGRRRRKPFPLRWAGEPDASYRVRLLLGSRAQWMFGLFRTDDARDSLKRVLDAYPHLNAFDHLVLFPLLVSLRIVGTNATSFVTGFVERPASNKARPLVDPARMREERADFMRYCRTQLRRLRVGGLVHVVLPRYAERSQRLTEIWRSQWRLMRGETPTGATRKYD